MRPSPQSSPLNGLVLRHHLHRHPTQIVLLLVYSLGQIPQRIQLVRLCKRLHSTNLRVLMGAIHFPAALTPFPDFKAGHSHGVYILNSSIRVRSSAIISSISPRSVQSLQTNSVRHAAAAPLHSYTRSLSSIERTNRRPLSFPQVGHLGSHLPRAITGRQWWCRSEPSPWFQRCSLERFPASSAPNRE